LVAAMSFDLHDANATTVQRARKVSGKSARMMVSFTLWRKVGLKATSTLDVAPQARIHAREKDFLRARSFPFSVRPPSAAGFAVLPSRTERNARSHRRSASGVFGF
jgi:hypothetical protein